ncbi:hypothetical protein SAMN02745243_02759 [Hespellia stercorisuis DSM 15480]|uniref:Uncharacterized protein n=1 Tax=Hespellia stercorisuis DSM 15480 TaxID=1121950 RepID=A0A1M6RQN4_9FIRM|nr:hypothetical protein SAMN02745243_02759 [Hespellia stercorisuis DSM 15480]
MKKSRKKRTSPEDKLFLTRIIYTFGTEAAYMEFFQNWVETTCRLNPNSVNKKHLKRWKK